MIKPYPRKRSRSTDVKRIQTVATVSCALRRLPRASGTAADVCIMSRCIADPKRVLCAMEVAGQVTATRAPHKAVLWTLSPTPFQI